MLETPSILWYTDLMTQCENPLGADNQQRRSILTPDFLGGLITGEGSYFVGIRRARVRGYKSLYPGFSIRMNDLEIIDDLCYAFDQYGQDYYRTPAKYRGCAQVSVIGIGRMRKHLDFFLPYLGGNKKRAATLVSEFVDYRLNNRNATYSEYEVGIVEQLREINGPSRVRLPIETLRDYTLRPVKKGEVEPPLPLSGKI